MFRSASGRRSGGWGWHDPAAVEESYRILRSNLIVSLADLDSPTVIVTSAEVNEGKTVTCTNLAISFAKAGRRVIVVDFDLRHPNAHIPLGAHNEFGVADVLLGRRPLDECLQYLELTGQGGSAQRGVYFLGTGQPVANPTELLAMGRTARLLDTLGQQADLVLIDTPPVLSVADTLVIGRMASGAVLVVEARKTGVPAITQAKDLLIRNQTRLLGIVLNKFRPRDAGYDYDHLSGAPPGPEWSTNGDTPEPLGNGHGTAVRR
jgi:capsular exopolysaccharide synthesis family protein